MFHKISPDTLQHSCIIPNTEPKNLVLFTEQSTLKTLPPSSHIPKYFIRLAHCKQPVLSERTGKLYHYYLNKIELKKTEALNVMSNSTPKSKQIFNKIYRCNIEPDNKSISSAKKILPIKT